MTEALTTFRTLGKATDLPDDYVNFYYVDDLRRRISVARVMGQLFAFDGLCTHELCPLSAGMLTGTSIMCQCHASTFDLASGAVLSGPAQERLRTYPVREHEGELQVAV